jgi:hypothetical protein
MLTAEQDRFIAKNFNIYEHNWKFYEALLGEANLVDDTLCYCDGSGLYLAAFSLEKPYREFSDDEISKRLASAIQKYPRADISFINIWGQFKQLARNFAVGASGDLYLCEQSEYFETGFETIFNVEEFWKNPTKNAKKRMRNVKASSIMTSIARRDRLNYEHMSVFEKWMELHKVSRIHCEFFYVLPTYLKSQSCYIIEARHDERLVGFSIVSVVSEERMVALNSFPLREVGLRAGDALFLKTIEFATENNIRWIHRGYSAIDSLLATKESWGATMRTKPFREAFYARNEETANIIADGRFLWRMRLASELLQIS